MILCSVRLRRVQLCALPNHDGGLMALEHTALSHIKGLAFNRKFNNTQPYLFGRFSSISNF